MSGWSGSDHSSINSSRSSTNYQGNDAYYGPPEYDSGYYADEEDENHLNYDPEDYWTAEDEYYRTEEETMDEETEWGAEYGQEQAYEYPSGYRGQLPGGMAPKGEREGMMMLVSGDDEADDEEGWGEDGGCDESFDWGGYYARYQPYVEDVEDEYGMRSW